MRFVSVFVVLVGAAAACANSSGSFVPDEAGAPDAGNPNDPQGPTIFVAPDGTDDSDGTAPTSPKRTIQAAIKAAKACPDAPCLVKVAAGKYLETVNLYAGVHVYGGYTRDFAARDATANVVTISSSDPRTVIAEGLR